ncbi:MAG: pentapeptide repeat-containing protein [Cyanobacteria bacterium P01_A01_bin.84]
MKPNQKILIPTIFGLAIFGVSLPHLYKVDWIGFGKEKIITIAEEEVLNFNNGKTIKLKKKTEQIQPAKSLWDWIGLLIGLTGSIGAISIPILAIRLTNEFQKNERERAEQTAKEEAKKAKLIGEEEALQNYIDKMSDLLIDKNLDELTDENPLSNIIQARTTSIIRRLDENLELKRNIIVFLTDTKIIQKLKIDWSTADLSHINLSNAKLITAKLTGANLTSAKLSAANLIAADLTGANLTSATLSRVKLLAAKLSGAKLIDTKLNGANLFIATLFNADLSAADLSGAYLSGAYLSGATLSGADLSGADLSGATLSRVKLIDANLNCAIFWDKKSGKQTQNITPEQIKQAKNWKKAIYSPEFRKELGLPPEKEE